MSNESAGAAQAVIVFDGVCVLCNGWVRFLLRQDRQQHYCFAAMQSASGRRLLKEHGLDPDDPVSFLLVEDGRAWRNTDAIRRVVASLGGFWCLAHVIVLMPRVVRDALYRLVARNRYRWFGKHDSCYLPSMEENSRFLR